MTCKLTEQQTHILNKYINGENIFITGPGGTGKTHLIRTIYEHAKLNNKAIHISALTGCAAILLECNATTLHTFAGIGLASGTINEVVDKVVKNRHKRVKWNKTDILIVDEVSMLSLKLFKIIDLIGKKIKKKRDIPFGGMQIIFAADFYQLPPVGNIDDPETLQFCFETELWNETFPLENQIELNTIFRQTDNTYAKILNNLRIGKITKSTIKLLESCVGKETDNEDFPVILNPIKREVDIINNKEFARLDKENEKDYQIESVIEDDLPLTKEQRENFSLFTEKERNVEREYLMNNIMAEKNIKLRKGTIVMCIANLNFEDENPIVNGSQGIVIDFVNGNPLIKFGKKTQVIGYHTWQSERLPGIAIKQLPLIYGWAITIHKAQGMTLDKALIDIGNNIFECGQTYVALSRIKTIEGLYLKNFDYTKIKINKKVFDFYNNLKK